MVSIIVPGSLNTDIVGMGVPAIVGTGELAFGGTLAIQPGGKSRNTAQMIAVLLGKNTVTMLGRTARDPYGLWKIPFQALKKSGVRTKGITIVSSEKGKNMPGIALIPVDTEGKNQIYVLPGVNTDFSPQDIKNAEPIFRKSGDKGILCMTLELPQKTAEEAIKMAHKFGQKIILDPGGINVNSDNSSIFRYPIFLLKPNEHEAKILTGITISSPANAKKAIKILLEKGVENVLITIGKNGAYFGNSTHFEHIPVCDTKGSKAPNETGCGDQTTATICAYTVLGYPILEAAKIAILSGNLQFYKPGITPVTRKEIERWINKVV